MKRHPSCKLTIDQEQEVIKQYLAGTSARQLAKDWGFAWHSGITKMLKAYNVQMRDSAERNRLYAVNPHMFDEIDTEHKAYWWGFIYADGNVHKRSLIVALKYSDKQHLKKLKTFMEAESPIHHRVRNAGIHSTNNARIEFTDKHLSERLKRLGILPKRPSFDFVTESLPSNLVQHWTRGYFDGDGSARKDKSISFIGQKCLLEFIRRTLAMKAGTNPLLKIQRHKHSNIYYLSIGGRIQALKVADYMYKDATVWLERKRDVILSWPKPKQRFRDEKGRYI